MSEQSMPTVGQRIESAIVDVIFLGLIGYLAAHHVLSEAVIAGIFGTYAAGRFGIKAGKQQAAILARVTAGGGGDGSNGPPSAPGAGSGRVMNGRSSHRSDGGMLRRMLTSPSPVIVAIGAALAFVMGVRNG